MRIVLAMLAIYLLHLVQTKMERIEMAVAVAMRFRVG